MTPRHTSAIPRGDLRDSAACDRLGQAAALVDKQPSRAVNKSRSIGRPGVFGVRPDRFDHQVEFIGAVDLARYAVGLIRRDELGFGEVVQTINALSVAVLHQEHRARTVFRPREQEQVIGAEVEHQRWAE